MIKLNKPLRMCIICRKRFYQNELLRFQCKEGEFISFSGEGRSFYFCKECYKNEDKIVKSLFRYCKKDREKILQMVRNHKEKIVNG